MATRTDNPKPRATVAKETHSSRPLDNLDLDVADAARLGYGVHYGKYKADHPYTKDANEARLEEARKKRGARSTIGPKVYEKVCPACGKKFTTQTRDRKYCDDKCKYKRDSARYREKHPKKEATT